MRQASKSYFRLAYEAPEAFNVLSSGVNLAKRLKAKNEQRA
ncbi:MAG: hypothetical protein ACI8VW_003605 [bacterium]|jgi:hypothetical protein